jgi:peptidoglycan/LPS O-acetylase OafA/YrhL
METSQKSNIESQRWLGVEGLRGLCIIAVLTYHYWVKQLPGGFLGVSVFFTISGFVITNGLIRLSEKSSHIDVYDFLVRRFRRLWPAATLVLAVTLLYSLIAGWASRTMASDSFAAFFQYYNWRVITTGTVYGQSLPSIFGHFWSLSIEAQFYVIAPLIFLISRGRKLIQISLFVTILIVAIVVATNSSSLTFVYSSTITRSAEISVGCLLAFVIKPIKRLTSKPILDHLASLLAFLAFATLTTLTLKSSMQTSAYAHGGLVLISILSALLIIGASFGKVASAVFSLQPLTWLGRISYSLYLVHFPIRIILIWSGIWPEMQTWLSVAVSIIVASLLFRFIERPFRESRYLPNTKLILATALVLLFTITQIVVHRNPPIDEKSFESLQNELQTLTENGGALGHDGLPRIAIYGDSMAINVSIGLSKVDSDFKFLGGYTVVGCPIGNGGVRRGFAATGDDPNEVVWPVEPECRTQHWIDTTQSLAPIDIGIILTGNWDLVGRQIDALGPDWHTILDPEYQKWLYNEMEFAIDGIHNAGVKRVMWLTLPANVGYQPSQRLIIFNQLVEKIASTRDWMIIVDYASYIRAHNELRPDGIHVSQEQSLTFVEAWLVDQINEVALTSTR